MLDRKFIVENAEQVKQNCTNRGIEVDVDRFVELEGRRKELQVEVDGLNREANQVSKSIGKAKDEAEREARKEEGRRLRRQVAESKAELDRVASELAAVHRMIPNISHP
ncbi:MAG: serine--tRNA ligase, partial [Planctomycetota bacterium]